MIRAVLDTNVLISALLFSGLPSRLVPAWQTGRVRPVLSAAILDEYIRALAYPKLRLTPEEVRSLLEEEFLPFVESVGVEGISYAIPSDPDDAKFIECALAADVPWVVTGDAALLELEAVRSVSIINVRAFLNHLNPSR